MHFLLRGTRELKEKRGAVAFCGFQPDSPTQHFNKSFRDRQPQSGAFIGSGMRNISLDKPFEDGLLSVFRNPDAGIPHIKFYELWFSQKFMDRFRRCFCKCNSNDLRNIWCLYANEASSANFRYLQMDWRIIFNLFSNKVFRKKN